MAAHQNHPIKHEKQTKNNWYVGFSHRDSDLGVWVWLWIIRLKRNLSWAFECAAKTESPNLFNRTIDMYTSIFCLHQHLKIGYIRLVSFSMFIWTKISHYFLHYKYWSQKVFSTSFTISSVIWIYTNAYPFFCASAVDL